MASTLPISETFHSIQGEGKLTGVPSFFMRLSGCNLRCAWCDTPYASWNPDGGPQSIDALADAASVAKHVVVTGGEPLIFDRLPLLLAALKHRGLHITIETAGTVFQPELRAGLVDLISISPKLSNSTPRNDPRDADGKWMRLHEARRINLEALQALIDLPCDRQLKFVVAEPGDLAEIDAVLAKLHRWSPADILLMPEGITPPTAERKQWIADACVERGWRYCSRLHIELFGNKRGT
jgi:7-carboxy-7-deazaguanine synthase